MVWVIYHNTNSTTMNDLYLKFDPSSNMNLTNLLLMCNVMANRKQIWTLALLLFPGCYMISSVSVPVLLPGVVLTISLITVIISL